MTKYNMPDLLNVVVPIVYQHRETGVDKYHLPEELRFMLGVLQTKGYIKRVGYRLDTKKSTPVYRITMEGRRYIKQYCEV